MSLKTTFKKKTSLSSQLWIKRQRKDIYIKKSIIDEYRSRAAYKLLQIDKKNSIINPEYSYLDLGCAPGSWSQVLSRMNVKKIISVDIIETTPIQSVHFIQGDFLDLNTQQKILKHNISFDCILSDIAPSTTGVKSLDHIKSAEIVSQIFQFCNSCLKCNGNLLVKIFQGESFEELIKQMKLSFKIVKCIKPESSRKNSSEIYILCKEFKKNSS